jgi:hypothetical protein
MMMMSDPRDPLDASGKQKAKVESDKETNRIAGFVSAAQSSIMFSRNITRSFGKTFSMRGGPYSQEWIGASFNKFFGDDNENEDIFKGIVRDTEGQPKSSSSNGED